MRPLESIQIVDESKSERLLTMSEIPTTPETATETTSYNY